MVSSNSLQELISNSWRAGPNEPNPCKIRQLAHLARFEPARGPAEHISLLLGTLQLLRLILH